MLIRLATSSDLPRIATLERTPWARQFVGQWSVERHIATFAGRDARYYVSGPAGEDLQAYAILRGLEEESGSIELKRIVVAKPGFGLGRSILKELIRITFTEFKAHRMFLDVYDDNLRARHLYENLGFRYEGIMRDAARRDNVWCDLHLMSLLEDEYVAR